MFASYSKTQFSKEIQETLQSTGTTKNRDLETAVQTSASKATFVAACYRRVSEADKNNRKKDEKIPCLPESSRSI